MPTNVYFNHAVQTEQHLYEDLVVESLRFYGHDVLYLPRTIVEEDSILNDDIQSTFGDAYSVEMYLENVEGFEGEGDLVSKFGVQIQEEATFILSLRTWERFISLDSNLATSLRPNEGDLIYFPLGNQTFEINFVEDQDPFFQMSKMFVFKMRCSLFSYGGEDFDTGTVADLVEADSAYTIELTMNTGSGNFIHGENLTTVIDSATVTVGEVVLWQPQARKLTIKDNTRTLQVNDILTGATSSTVRTIGAITDVLSFGQDHSAQNLEFEQQDSSYLDFSEVNPFGEP